MNSRIYLAEYPDGHIQELSANTIIEAIYNQVDDFGVKYVGKENVQPLLDAVRQDYKCYLPMQP